MISKLLALSILTLAGLACVLQAPTAPAQAVAATPSFTATPAPTNTPYPTLERTQKKEYTVVAWQVYVRDKDLEIVTYMKSGEQVQCNMFPSGWCLMENGWRIWGGCLDPNPEELGCEVR